MDIPYVVLAVVAIGVSEAIVRSGQSQRNTDQIIANWCRENGIPKASFDYTAATHEVIAGTRSGIRRDG